MTNIVEYISDKWKKVQNSDSVVKVLIEIERSIDYYHQKQIQLKSEPTIIWYHLMF